MNFGINEKFKIFVHIISLYHSCLNKDYILMKKAYNNSKNFLSCYLCSIVVQAIDVFLVKFKLGDTFPLN